MKISIFNFKFKSIALAFTLLLSFTAYAQVADTLISKTMEINPKGLVKINDAGFPVEIHSWNKNEFKLSYHLAVQGNSQEDLSDFLEDFAKAIESQLEKVTTSEIELSGLFKLSDYSDKRVKLNFRNAGKHVLKRMDGKLVVYLPKTVNLKLSSSFHNIEIDDMDSDLNISINSAHLKMESCNDLILNSSFGNDLQVGSVKSAYINVNSGKLNLNSVEGDLELKGNFSDFKVGSVNGESKIEINSSSFISNKMDALILKGSFIREFKVVEAGDIGLLINSSKFYAQKIKSCMVSGTSFSTIKIVDLEFLNVQSVSSTKFYFSDLWHAKIFESSFSDFSILKLANTFEMNSKSGSVKIKEVASDFLKIKIDGQFTTTDIHINEKANYKLEAQLQFPKYTFGKLNIESENKTINNIELEGWHGDKAKASLKVILDCESCDIKLE